MILIMSISGPGLSPRVRGSPFQIHGADVQGGSIPAGAGEPEIHLDPTDAHRVYPRGCGGASLA